MVFCNQAKPLQKCLWNFLLHNLVIATLKKIIRDETAISLIISWNYAEAHNGLVAPIAYILRTNVHWYSMKYNEDD